MISKYVVLKKLQWKKEIKKRKWKKELKKWRFYIQRWVKVMKDKTNIKNNVELLLLETWNLLDGYMAKELSLLWTL